MVQKIAIKLLLNALDFGASDIYILPTEGTFSISLRHSASRKHYAVFSESIGQSLISHFKFIAGMNVGEKRRTQLGSCSYVIAAQTLRIRLSTVGDFQNRESLVLRLLPKSDAPLLFWDETDLTDVLSLVDRRGLYLFSGPVGSGKTTLMNHIAKEKFFERQVITIEDPVELVSPEFLQLQLNEAIGNTYDHLIKLSLRHMPDLVIVGEIRDQETARAVIRASLTGYTVFSTVHARSISGVYARLIELGIDSSELTNALSAIVYQRLIGGKGILTYADKNFHNHTTQTWHNKIQGLVKSGDISSDMASSEKNTHQTTSQTDDFDA